MLTPIGTSGVCVASFSASAPAPSLLNPSRLSSARSSGSRNILGGGFPGCACAVTVPTSAYPKPSAPQVPSPRPFLSNPAASPSGPGKRMPNTVLANTGSCGASDLFRARRAGAGAVPTRRPLKTQVWMRSAGTRNSARRRARYITPLHRRLVGDVQAVDGGLLAAQQHSAAAVGVEPNPGEFPAAILRLDGQPGGRADPGQVWGQPKRHPFVLVGQIDIPPRRHEATLDRRHRLTPAFAITCTPAPEPDTTYRVPDASSKAREFGCCTVG